MTEESAVKVCVRVRPLIEREESAATENAEPVQLYWKAEKKSIQQIDDGNPTKTFSFDRVFSSEETTHQLYQDIAKPLVVSTVEGYNGTIFAYGQTSSGKTFTMMGSDLVPGVIPLAMEDVFQTIKNFPKKEFLLRVSYMEIYNETVTDLLVDSWKRKPLEVRETINKNVYVADLTEELVTSPAQALAWIRKGEKNRHYGKTKMNQRSSRSHTIFRMILESRERSDPASGENADGAIIVSHLNLVDLAGSERASQTGAEGARFKEGCNINRSLFTLGQVIKKLSDESQRGFTNYRDSKLTRILQNSLGGNAKTVIICTITPAALDETVSTLQFASTAKNMKNDPHVTEVSDDGALLKRYRNEIVDLKRRLQEVSSITHTTATEKKVLSQLLQEKDQLQREQEDRIRNLTKLLVTSSNFVPVPKMPKRRVTWGGKLLRMAQASESDMGLSDLSFAESVTRKRKAERSCLTELAEDDEDFDSRWEIPEEPSYDAEMNQSSVTVHSFGDSPKDFISPNRIHELSDKVSNLEVQLELETNQKDQAVMKAQTLDAKVAELEEQLKTEAQQKQEAQEKIETVEQRLGELDLKLQSEAQEKQDATEWVEMLELKVADLERQLAQQSQVPSETEQMRKEFAETIQLCETLVSEKEMVTAERDYLKQELGLFMEQTVTLEKENTALSKELEEKKEMDEFRYLEETCRNEHENELKNEISSLKNAVESSELKCQELEAKLQAMSEELKKKAEWAAELQSMNDKDLVQQVTQLRRSLDDAEGLSRDTKKEWAVLRSQNIALKERDEALTASYEKMEAEVTGLRSELEAEKSRYKKMQMDLQKELNVAFDENTKLTTLLDGKVPKNLIDSVELERTVANLNKELAASRDTEGALQAQLEEMASLRDLPDKVKNLMKQVSELTEELCSVQTQRDSLLSAQAQSQEEVEQLRDSLQTSQDEIIRIQGDLGTAELREQDLSQRFAAATEQLERFRSELEHSEAEKSQLLATVEETHLRLDEGDQQRASLEEKLNEVQQLMKDLEEKLADSELSRTTEEEIGKELQEQLNQATEELQRLQTEKDAFLSEKTSAVQSSAEEMENLLSKVASLTEERDQLKMDLQENVKMLNQVTEELQSVGAEKDQLLSEKTSAVQTSAEEMENLLSKVASLTEERDQLKMDLQANVERLTELTEELQSVRAEKDALLSEKTSAVQTSPEEMENLLSKVASLTEERDQLKMDLQENVEMMIENQEELRTALEKNREQKERLKQLETAQMSTQDSLTNEKHALQLEELQNQIKALTEELQSVRAERDSLLSERAANPQTSGGETEQLLSKVTSLSEERDQLQEILEGLKEEKRQLKADLEERMEMMQSDLQQQLDSGQQNLKEEQDAQKLLQIQQLEEQLERTKEEMSQLRIDLKENVEMMIENQEELRVAQEKIRVLEDEINRLQTEKAELESRQGNGSGAEIPFQLEELQNQSSQIQQLTAEIESVRAERDTLLSERAANLHTSGDETEQLLSKVTSLSEERDQLQEILEGLREEKRQLKADLEERMETLQVQLEQLHASLQTVTEQKSQLESDLQQNTEMAATSQILLHSIQEELREQKQKNSDLEKLGQEKECSFDQQMRTLTEKLESIQAERDGLLSEKAASLHDTEEMKRLLLQMEEELKQEKIQRKADMEEKMEKISVIQEKLKEQEDLSMQAEEVAQLQHEIQQLKTEQTNITEENSQLQRELQDKTEMINQAQVLLKQQQHLNAHLQEEKEQQEAQLRKQVQQLQEELHILKERQSHAKAEAEASHQLLSEANTTISVLKGQISSLDQSSNGTSEAKEGGLSARLQDSTLQLQERFSRFQLFKNSCSEFRVGIAPLDHALRVQDSLMHPHLTTLPNPTIKTYSAVRKLWMQTIRTLGNITKLPLMACDYKRSFQELVKKDLAVFEERRLQDVLLCRVQAPSYSVKEEDLQTLWEHRLSELLDKREFYLQKMDSLLEKLEATMTTYSGDLSEGLREKERFSEQLQALLTMQPLNLSTLDSVLSCELSHCSAVAHSKKMILQGMLDEHIAQSKELEQLEMQADVQLREERSKTSTLLQMLESAPLKTEADLLSDNQQLALQLQQSEKEVKAMNVKIVQLEEAQVKAKDLVSNHKQATQLLQTELQDARAQVSEKGNTIQSLKKKLQEAEDYAKKNASPSAIELEKLRDQVVKMKVELTSASSKHQEEIKKMNTLLNIKEESLRKLKETLRKSQQDGEESILQGKDLYDRLTNSKGLIVQSSILLEKTKLEEEVKLLQVKIAELESLVSSQQAEIAKWKSRAIKLKEKSKVVVDKPLSPCTPTKRRLPMTSDCSNFITSPKRFLGTPKKTLDSPKMVDSPKKLLSCPDSPKTRFFDGTESLTRNCPKQFFDNSNLGTLPEISCAPSVADEASLGAEEDVATGAEKREEWWPLSPKQADLCKNQ
ncbi:centromere-associated protein E isoform X7 [Myripristis murdjan]|uniref:centromere-associated protein E isoform X7 n=1 Tax=Myripristis murdjan TaxID=586833 RepID=UPI0011762BF2|nr:centromere-associated protein E isoform X7 [Myripristis murdjan]